MLTLHINFSACSQPVAIGLLHKIQHMPFRCSFAVLDNSDLPVHHEKRGEIKKVKVGFTYADTL